MHRAFTFALLSASAVLLSACATQGTDTGSAPELAGRTLVWADPVASSDKTPVIRFGTDGRVSGVTGCNNVMGSFTQEGGKLTFSRMGTTMMMCSPDAMKTEAAYLANLEATRGVTEADGAVLLTDEAGKVLMRLTPQG